MKYYKKNLGGLLIAIGLCGMMAAGCWNPKSDRVRETPSETPTASPERSPEPKATANSNSKEMDAKQISGGFIANLPDGFEKPNDEAGSLLLREYGAVFVARGEVKPPKTVVFKDQAEVSAFQSSLTTSNANIGGIGLELQASAMDGLKKAVDEAKAAGVSISPRDKDSAKRSYNETIELWASRVDPALKYWVGKGRMTQAQADALKKLSPYEQVPEVLKLESQGIYFAKDLSKSIIYSVAPPGTSQHLSMLALDVKENNDPKVREILARNGWYQTVTSDLPHFTFLGVPESELPKLGLKKVETGGRVFWVPDLSR